MANRVEMRPLGIDDFSALRYLHAKSLIAQTADAISDAQAEELVRLIYSPEYSRLVLDEDCIAAWLDGEMVGAVSWQPSREGGESARIGPLFVRHPRFGIGRRLLGEAEARARAGGFDRYTAWSIADGVPFFVRLGYRVTSHGVKAFTPTCALPVTFLRKDAA